jgi:hypothetical protein
MKKVFLALTLSLVLMSFCVMAEQPARDATGPMHDEIVAAGGQNGTGPMLIAEQVMEQVQAGQFRDPQGNAFGIEMAEGNRIRLRVGNVTAETDLDIKQQKMQDKVQMSVKLSNGRNAEVKVMPNTASERALERLRLRVCTAERNCTIELKEVGSGNQTRLAYEVQAERHARILGLFQTKMQVRAQVDAENGEVISTGKPWWAFLATEPAETEETQTE